MSKVFSAQAVALAQHDQTGTRATTRTLLGATVMVLLMQVGGVQAQSSQYKPDQNIYLEQERRDAERAAQQRAQQERSTDVKLIPASTAPVGLLPTDETPCFNIQLVTLDAGLDPEPKDLLDAIAHTSSGVMDTPIGRCIGAKGVQIVIDRLQNELIARGYVTSRILAKPQNLQTGNEDAKKALQAGAMYGHSYENLSFVSMGSPVSNSVIKQNVTNAGATYLGQVNDWRDPVTNPKLWVGGAVGGAVGGVGYVATLATGIATGPLGWVGLIGGTSLLGLSAAAKYGVDNVHPFHQYIAKPQSQSIMFDWLKNNPQGK